MDTSFIAGTNTYGYALTNAVYKPVDSVVKGDGRILVAGTGANANQVLVESFQSDGAPDRTFGLLGTFYLTGTRLQRIEIQGDGKIVLLTSDPAKRESYLTRLQSNGLIDNTFGSYGVVTTSKIIAADFAISTNPANGDFVYLLVGKATSDGYTTFLALNSSGGTVNQQRIGRGYSSDVSTASFTHIAVDHNVGANNSIVMTVPYVEEGRSRVSIARLTPNFKQDLSNGEFGEYRPIVTDSNGSEIDFVPKAKLNIFAANSYLIAGYTRTPTDLFADHAALEVVNGQVNNAFGYQGFVQIPYHPIISIPQGEVDYANTSLVDPDGNIFLAGGIANGAAGSIFSLFANGHLNTAFGNNGLFTAGKPIVDLEQVPFSKRFVAVQEATYMTRHLEANANLISIGSFDTTMSESGQDTAGLIVARSERLPYATRVYLQASGSTTALGDPGGAANHDFTGFSNSPIANYVDIPANQTFVSLTLTPVDDTRAEGTETLTMSVLPSDGYDVAEPHAINYVLYDNETDETIVDNKQAVFTSGWQTSTSTGGYYGTNYAHDNNEHKGEKSAQFNGHLQFAGYYQVLVRWTADPNRAFNVPIDITSTAGTETVTVNQTKNGGTWNSLGTYQFAAGGGIVTIRTDGTKGYVVADAVRFIKVAAPTIVTVDNDDALRVKKFGFWSSSTSIGGYLGSDYLHENNRLFGAASIVYDFSGITTGKYEVQARWTANDNRATNAKFDITTATGTISTVRVNQRQNGNAWVSLGLFDLSSLTAAIKLSNDGADGFVIADGVRLVKVQ